MAIQRMTIDGYGQVELNNVAFRRDGRVEAQCKLASGSSESFENTYAENGMLLAIDRAARKVQFPVQSGTLPIGLHYSAEHIYEAANGLKNFKLEPNSFLPRLGLLAVGDKWTTNCIAYNSAEFADDAALKTALAAFKTTPVYGGIDTTGGAVLVSANAPTDGPVLKVVEYTTMPDGQPAVMLQVLSV